MTATNTSSFVECHRLGPLEFNISSPVKPISIRDQMVRAQMLVDGLYDEAIIAPGRVLLIVGGGAAAATAALTAQELKVPVVMVNKAADFFTLQEKCISRWIDPTQYDWPAWHWEEAVYPWHQPQKNAPLPWEAQLASELATNWSVVMDEAQSHPSPLNVLHENELTSIPVYDEPSQTMLCDVRDIRANILQTITVGCVLYAVGFGRERSSIGNYQGEPFWQTDTLQESRVGWNSISQRVRIAICGGGDGALQDFIRVATGLDSAGALMKIVRPYLDPRDELIIASEEDQAQRALLWSTYKGDEHHICTRLETTYETIIGRLLTNEALVEELYNLLKDRMAEIEVRLFHSCSHFSPSFALNRFLVLLLCGLPCGFGLVRVSGFVVKLVSGVNHACSAEHPELCKGKEHELFLRGPVTCDDDKGKVAKEQADLVILRLGIERLEFKPLEKKVMLLSRQILPYFPPQLYG